MAPAAPKVIKQGLINYFVAHTAPNRCNDILGNVADGAVANARDEELLNGKFDPEKMEVSHQVSEKCRALEEKTVGIKRALERQRVSPMSGADLETYGVSAEDLRRAGVSQEIVAQVHFCGSNSAHQ